MVDHGHMIFSQASLPALVLDQQDRIVDVNPSLEELCGHAGRHLSNSAFHDLFLSRSWGPLSRETATEESACRDHGYGVLISKRGREIPVRMESISYTVKGENFKLILFIDCSDIEGFIKRNLHMARLASLGKVLSGIIHEMSNPLAVINGCAQLLAMENLTKDIEAQVKRILGEAQRTSGLVKKVLSFARKELATKI